jgi:cellulose synthase/poly-beta-1,6-N-acetylglucosamine synthase-like glycosyltransferase
MFDIWELLLGITFGHILWTWIAAYLRGKEATHRPLLVPESDQTPLASVIIPAWNERGVLADTIAALRQTDYPHWEAVIIAGGADGTLDFARQLCADLPNFTVLEQPPRGKNAALNLGLNAAKGEFIALIDADTQIAPGWIRLLSAALSTGFDAVAPRPAPSLRTWVSEYFEMEQISAYFVHAQTNLQGGGLMIRRSMLEKLGGFPENVRAGVDFDLDQRIIAAGGTKAFIPHARHTTPLATTLHSYFRNEVRWRRAHFAVITRQRPLQWWRFSFYVVAVLFWIMPIVSLLPGFAPLWIIFWSWVLLRRGAITIEVATVTQNPHWLTRFWVPPVLVVVSFAAALYGFIIPAPKNPIFEQGERPPA